MPAANYAHEHQLKPCPFCGSNDLTLDNLADPKHGWFINCNICEVQQIAGYTKAQSVALWNRRSPATDAMVTKACVALAELKSNIVGLEGQRKATTETIVRTVLTAAQQ